MVVFDNPKGLPQTNEVREEKLGRHRMEKFDEKAVEEILTDYLHDIHDILVHVESLMIDVVNGIDKLNEK